MLLCTSQSLWNGYSAFISKIIFQMPANYTMQVRARAHLSNIHSKILQSCGPKTMLQLTEQCILAWSQPCAQPMIVLNECNYYYNRWERLSIDSFAKIYAFSKPNLAFGDFPFYLKFTSNPLFDCPNLLFI